jgi:hypothetical protein
MVVLPSEGMLGGVIAIAWGLFLLTMAWDAMWPIGVWPQELLTQWVVGSVLVGGVLRVGGARAAGAALVGSSVCSFLAFILKRLYGGDHLETLVHGAVILGTIGLVVFGLAGLRRRAHAPLGRFPLALALAFGTVVVGALLILRIQADAVIGFGDPWVQPLLAFNVVFLALLFMVQGWQASRSSGKPGQEGDTLSAEWDRLIGPLARGGGPPFLL